MGLFGAFGLRRGDVKHAFMHLCGDLVDINRRRQIESPQKLPSIGFLKFDIAFSALSFMGTFAAYNQRIRQSRHLDVFGVKARN